jgi:hypothetical protein
MEKIMFIKVGDWNSIAVIKSSEIDDFDTKKALEKTIKNIKEKKKEENKK